jgi:hypothetical protein
VASPTPFNDPHIESLLYVLDTDKTLVFENPQPIDHETPDFRLRLGGGRLAVTMKTHFADAEEAQKAVKPFLDAWELDFALARGRREMRFKFDRPVIVDLKPSPGESSVLRPFAAEMIAVTATATLVVPLRDYPQPPAIPFMVTADVETLWNRYEGSLLGREPLPGMGYFCLTLFERKFGGRQAAATALRVSGAVLSTLGKLTTERGDATTARKAIFSAPLAPAEAEWIKTCLRELIRRAAMIAAGSPPSAQFTMSELPLLPPIS